jgi:hypothetical protein
VRPLRRQHRHRLGLAVRRHALAGACAAPEPGAESEARLGRDARSEPGARPAVDHHDDAATGADDHGLAADDDDPAAADHDDDRATDDARAADDDRATDDARAADDDHDRARADDHRRPAPVPPDTAAVGWAPAMRQVVTQVIEGDRAPALRPRLLRRPGHHPPRPRRLRLRPGRRRPRRPIPRHRRLRPRPRLTPRPPPADATAPPADTPPRRRGGRGPGRPGWGMAIT